MGGGYKAQRAARGVGTGRTEKRLTRGGGTTGASLLRWGKCIETTRSQDEELAADFWEGGGGRAHNNAPGRTK